MLVFVAMWARHARTVPIALFYGLPLLGISALNTVAGLSSGTVVFLAFAAAYAVGAWGGYLVQGRWVLGRARRVRLAKESLTLVMMMTVFGANFEGGFLQAAAPQFHASMLFGMIFAAVLALSCGSFAGRSVRVWHSPISDPLPA